MEQEIINKAKEMLTNADTSTNDCKHYNNGFMDGVEYAIKALRQPIVRRSAVKLDIMELEVKFNNVTEAQAIALEELFAQMVNLGKLGGSRWVCFYADGDGNFRPKIEVNGREAQFADATILTDEHRKEMWHNGEFRIDFDAIAWALRKKNEK